MSVQPPIAPSPSFLSQQKQQQNHTKQNQTFASTKAHTGSSLSNSIRVAKFSVSSSSPSILSPIIDDLPPMNDDDSSSDEDIIAPPSRNASNKRPSSAKLRRPGAAPSSRAASIASGNSRVTNFSVNPPSLSDNNHNVQGQVYSNASVINGTRAALTLDNVLVSPRAGSAGVLHETGGVNDDRGMKASRRPVWSASFAVRRTANNDDTNTRNQGYKGIDGLGPVSPSSDEVGNSSNLMLKRRPSSSGHVRILNH